MRQITKFIIHCTATREGRDYTVADITRWHKARGFKTIGYHYVIYRDGSIHTGREEHLTGAHTLGQNLCSIGVCYVGGLDSDGHAKDTRTPEQKTALRQLRLNLHQRFPNATIHGHREFARKVCPCFDAATEYKNLFSIPAPAKIITINDCTAPQKSVTLHPNQITQ